MSETCRNTTHRDDGQWIVIHRRCNYSAFNGYKRTPSAYSLVGCKECSKLWRTKAKYVWRLSDGTMEEIRG